MSVPSEERQVPVGGEPLSAGRAEDFLAARPVRVVVGVDPASSLEPVVGTLRALRSNGLEPHLVHVLTPEDDNGKLSRARSALEAAGLGGTWIQRSGDVAQGLLIAAENQMADLIAIGASRSGEGSVAKSLLARSPISLLIARTQPRRPGRLTAVLATDHSDYMARCIDRLADWHLDGIRDLTVLTANEVIAGTAAMLVNGLPQFAGKAEKWVTERIEAENRLIAARFATLCPVVRAVAEPGQPKEVIEASMGRLDADLLILGAEPHGVLERIFMGSVTFDEVTKGTHSVLALKA